MIFGSSSQYRGVVWGVWLLYYLIILTYCFFKATQPLISTYNQFCEVVDNGKKVRAVFCDISKAFDNKAFWHKVFSQVSWYRLFRKSIIEVQQLSFR